MSPASDVTTAVGWLGRGIGRGTAEKGLPWKRKWAAGKTQADDPAVSYPSHG